MDLLINEIMYTLVLFFKPKKKKKKEMKNKHIRSQINLEWNDVYLTIPFNTLPKIIQIVSKPC